MVRPCCGAQNSPLREASDGERAGFGPRMTALTFSVVMMTQTSAARRPKMPPKTRTAAAAKVMSGLMLCIFFFLDATGAVQLKVGAAVVGAAVADGAAVTERDGGGLGGGVVDDEALVAGDDAFTGAFDDDAFADASRAVGARVGHADGPPVGGAVAVGAVVGGRDGDALQPHASSHALYATTSPTPTASQRGAYSDTQEQSLDGVPFLYHDELSWQAAVGAKDDDGARLGLKVGSEVHRTTAETVIMVARSRTITGAPQPPPFFETNELQSLENVR